MFRIRVEFAPYGDLKFCISMTEGENIMCDKRIQMDEKYRAANEAHALYDNLSMVVGSAMVITAGGAVSIAKKNPLGFVVYLSAIAVLIVLQIIYCRLSAFASIARCVSASMEQYGEGVDSKCVNGISTVYRCRKLQEEHPVRRDSIFRSVCCLNLFFIFIMSCLLTYELYPLIQNLYN